MLGKLFRQSRGTIEPHALHALGRPASSLLIYLQNRLLVTQSCLACLLPLSTTLVGHNSSLYSTAKAALQGRHTGQALLCRGFVAGARTCHKRTRLAGSVERAYLSSSGRGALCRVWSARIWQIYRWRQCRSSSHCSRSTGRRRLYLVSATFSHVVDKDLLSGRGPRRQPVLVEPLAVP